MSVLLSLYPTLTNELLIKAGYLSTNYNFYYTVNGTQYPLEAKPTDASYNNEVLLISDERCEWTPDTHELTFERTLILNHPHFLFGSTGIACEGSELGLALLWMSKSSSQRGVRKIGGFKKNDERIELSLHQTFPPGHLRGKVLLQIIVYLKTPGSVQENEQHLVNEAGVVLGVLDQFTIVLDGSGSIFPIVEVSEPKQPLWWVKCDWTDPQTEPFDEEFVQICLNAAHPHYNLLKVDQGLKESALLKDIISSALQIIILKVKESGNWDEIVTGRDCEPGSIGQAVHYFINTFGWDTNSPEKLAYTIRKDLDSRI